MALQKIPSYTEFRDSFTTIARRYGGLVTVRIYSTGAPATLPVEYRPPWAQYFTWEYGGSSGTITVNSDGTIEVTGGRCYATITYPAA